METWEANSKEVKRKTNLLDVGLAGAWGQPPNPRNLSQRAMNGNVLKVPAACLRASPEASRSRWRCANESYCIPVRISPHRVWHLPGKAGQRSDTVALDRAMAAFDLADALRIVRTGAHVFHPTQANEVITRNPAVVLVDSSVVSRPAAKRGRPDSDPLLDLSAGDFGFLRPFTDVIDHLIASFMALFALSNPATCGSGCPIGCF